MKGNSFLLTRIRALEARLAVLEQIIATMETRPQLRRHDLARKFGVSLRTIERATADKRLPKPTYVCGPMWRPDQIAGITLS